MNDLWHFISVFNIVYFLWNIFKVDLRWFVGIVSFIMALFSLIPLILVFRLNVQWGISDLMFSLGEYVCFFFFSSFQKISKSLRCSCCFEITHDPLLSLSLSLFHSLISLCRRRVNCWNYWNADHHANSHCHGKTSTKRNWSLCLFFCTSLVGLLFLLFFFFFSYLFFFIIKSLQDWLLLVQHVLGSFFLSFFFI